MDTAIGTVLDRTWGRARRGIRRYGVIGTVRQAGSRTRARVHRYAYLKEAHRWYEIDLRNERPRHDLPEGTEVIRADLGPSALAGQPRVADLGIKELDMLNFSDADRKRSGASLWLGLAGSQPVFGCWTFSKELPVLAAKGGWLELPVGATGLEGSIASPNYRKRGLAAGCLSKVADRLAEEGFTATITKVDEQNGPAQGMVEKVGFRELSRMQLVRSGPRWRVEVRTVADGQLSEFLHGRLTR